MSYRLGCRRSRRPRSPRGSRGASAACPAIEPLAGVGRYAPVDDYGLRDLLPDRGGCEVAVVEGPVVLAAGDVRLADDHDHREARVLRGQETDERSPHVQRVLAV